MKATRPRQRENAWVGIPEGGGYFSHEFVCRSVRDARRIVRIWSVRNIRVTEPDVTLEFKKFICDRRGSVEVLCMSADAPADIIDGIRHTLPNPSLTIDAFREEVRTNRRHIVSLSHDLGSHHTRLRYFETASLPLMHMCQFDDDIWLGFQFHRRDRDDTEGLPEHCTYFAASSPPGRKLLDNLRWVLENDATEPVKSLLQRPKWEGTMNGYETPIGSANGGGVVIGTMNGGVVQPVTAAGSAQVTINTIEGFDRRSLGRALEGEGIEPDDIASFFAADEADREELPVKIGTYGPGVTMWLSGMLHKAATGAWNVGIGVAGSTLSTYLDKYFGLR
jgi:hypothetical protein